MNKLYCSCIFENSKIKCVFINNKKDTDYMVTTRLILNKSDGEIPPDHEIYLDHVWPVSMLIHD